MKITFVLLSLVSSSVFAATPGHWPFRADMFNTKGEKIGVVEVLDEKVGVKFKVKLSKLTPGTHAIHIHEKGDCKTPDFKSAGGHLNPDGKKHGTDNPEGHHAGDLPNLEVKADGTVKADFSTNDVTLRRGAKNSLIRKEGASVVIHAGPDDNKTDPSGSSGDRIACGMITDQLAH